MPVKGATLSPPPSPPWLLRSGPFAQWRIGVFTALVFVGMLLVYSIDECTVKSLVDAWRPKQGYGSVKVYADSDSDLQFPSQNQTFNRYAHAPSEPPISPNSNFNSSPKATFTPQNQSNLISKPKLTVVPPNSTSLDWISVVSETKFTSNLLSRWLAPGGEPCRDSKTEQISIPELDDRDFIELPAGEVHEFIFTALDSLEKPRCVGGDYFETDLSGELWKSRPVVKDLGIGSYSMSLQVHPDFVGDFNLTVTLLFRHFDGLKMFPPRFAVDRQLRNIRIKFYKTEAKLPELKQCGSSDFSKDIWVGRWTRHGKNEKCQISNDGRFRCLPQNFKCKSPWCNGSLGVLESNGWVYSAHCSFQIFSSPETAWNCLKGKWIFFWGDSNHVDTIRNMLNFMLGLPDIKSVPRRFDTRFSNPKNPSETVRITSIFNGHSNVTMNYEGLDSLKHEEYRNLLCKYFQEEKKVPDTIIMNSGLHDGIHWSSVKSFSKGAEFAAEFWAEIMESIKNRGLKPPEIFYRTTVATGGYARRLAFNPSKMEAFNGIVLDKFRKLGLVSGVIDDFDITFPWHFDNRCNDGVHYGRGPSNTRWRDGEIGHQYFVDLMLGHILLNVLCLRS